MNARDRMIKALDKSGEPDRVPIFIEGMMNKFLQNTDALYGDQISDEDFLSVKGDWTISKFYGFDAQWLHQSPIEMLPLNGINPRELTTGNPDDHIDRWGHIDAKGVYQSGFLNTKEIWQEWIDAGYFEYNVNEDWIRRWEKGYPIMVEHDLIPIPVEVHFEKIREAFTFGRFSYFLRKERAFMEELASRIFAIGLDCIKGVCDAGFEIVTIADDSAYKNNVMFDPKIFEEIVAPGYKQMIDYLHKRGLLCFFHSDGFTEPFFPGLIGAGFDGIQSLEPMAGMNLKHLKETWGDKAYSYRKSRLFTIITVWH